MNSKIILSAITAVALGFLACSQPEQASAEIPVENAAVTKAEVLDVDATELKKLMVEQPGTILDVRTPDEVAEGVIPGAIHINIYDADFSQRIGNLDTSKPVYAYCKMGGRSAKAAKELLAHGFPQVYNLKGGITGWMKAGFETEQIK